MREKLAVYGTGTIGACQATLTSGNGYPTAVIGHSEAGLVRCREMIRQNWDDLIAEGLATEANKKAAMRLISITNDPAALEGAAVVFEAVAEDPAVKQEVYATITRYGGEKLIVASTTSSIDAEVLAKRIQNPSRLLIAHPFQPVHMLPLVEVVRHEQTSEEAVEKICGLLRNLNRQVVVLNRSVPGFLVNRFAQALFREAIYLMEQGVTTDRKSVV